MTLAGYGPSLAWALDPLATLCSSLGRAYGSRATTDRKMKCFILNYKSGGGGPTGRRPSNPTTAGSASASASASGSAASGLVVPMTSQSPASRGYTARSWPPQLAETSTSARLALSCASALTAVAAPRNRYHRGSHASRSAMHSSRFDGFRAPTTCPGALAFLLTARGRTAVSSGPARSQAAAAGKNERNMKRPAPTSLLANRP